MSIQENNKTIQAWHGFLDLAVPLSVELGSVQLRVREILDLKTDCIIKLPISTGEAIAVCADSQPLLLGEIVVIEDRTGVRISEIVSA